MAVSKAVMYALVGRPGCVLAEYSAAEGEFKKDARKILGETNHRKNNKITYAAEGIAHNVVVESSLVFLCVTHSDVRRAQAFKFLNIIQEQFYSQFGRLRSDQDYSPLAFNEDFSPLMKKRTDAFNEASDAGKLNDIQSDINSVKGVLKKNIEKVLERGEKMETLVFQTETLMDSSNAFRSNSYQLHRALWLKDVKFKVMIAVAIAALLYILYYLYKK